MGILSIISLLALVPLMNAAPIAVVEESDNGLFPPSSLPANWTMTCNFRRSRPCGKFFNLASNRVNFVLSAEDANANQRSMASIRYITTGRGARGTARYGSKYLIPSPYSPVKAICVSFRYRLIGNASLSLVEQPNGAAEHEYWKDAGKDAAMKNKWRFHTTQITQNVPVRLIFNAQVNGNLSAVALSDLTVYNYTCSQRDGDNLVPYVGATRALTDAPYWPANATIPYEIQPGYTADQKAVIMRFFSDANAKTCLRFVPRQNDETSYMSFIKADPGTGCTSDLGNVGQTKIMLEDSCFEEGYFRIAHMIMHGLGIRHEHVRPDRDNFVDIFLNNADPAKVAQFGKRSSGNEAVLALPYDLNSVMHFVNTELSIDGFSTTIQKKGYPSFVLSNKDGPTAIDYQKIAGIYCNGVTKAPNTPRPTLPTTTTTTTPAPVLATPCTSTTNIERKTGVITNTQVNGMYRPDENCGWLVTVTPGKAITMRFTMLDLEDSVGCGKDVVTVYDGDSWETAPIIAQLCGFNRPVENYTTSGNKMLVILSSDDDTQARGFSLSYQEIDVTPDVGPAADAALSPGDCNFEQSSCGWGQGVSDIDWLRKKLPGLDGDHSTGSASGYYLSIDASTTTANSQYAIMKSSRVEWQDAWACLAFWYRFVDPSRNIGKLQLWYANPAGDIIPLWSSISSNGDAYSEWVQAKVNIYDIDSVYFRFILNGTIYAPGKTGGIAVDDIIMTQDDCSSMGNNDLPPPLVDDTTVAPTAAPTPSVTTLEPEETPAPYVDGRNGYSCDFESDYCQWENATIKADANWLRASGRSTSGSSYGVQIDHTKQTLGAKYLLLNSMPNVKKTARLEVSVSANSGFKCFELYYLMYGKHMGRVRIMARLGTGEEIALFEASGNKNAKWALAQASLDSLSQAYTLIVEGYTTGQSDGDIGIDDFLLRSNDCYSAPLRQAPPTTTPYQTPNYAYLCDFEDGAMCTKTLQMSNLGTADKQFVNAQGSLATQNAGGPLYDHSQANSKGRFAAVNGGLAQQTAVLSTKMIGQDEVNCMTFWYWLSGNDTGSIKVSYIDSTGVQKTLYTIADSNRFVNQWTNPQIPIPRTVGMFSVQFTATMGGSRSYIAFDDIEMSRNSKCSPMSRSMVMMAMTRGRRQASSPALVACRFGDSTFCGWASNGKWQAVSTSAQLDISGPDDRFAHVTSGRLVVPVNNARTMGAPSADMASNITGILTSPVVSAVTASKSCFHFYYKISGWFRDLPMDVLNVYVQLASNPNKRRLIASLSGSMTPPSDSLDEWVQQQLTILDTQNYQMVFEATTGDSWIGAVAIDDVALMPSMCPFAFPQ